jgi:hypothetical protein
MRLPDLLSLPGAGGDDSLRSCESMDTPIVTPTGSGRPGGKAEDVIETLADARLKLRLRCSADNRGGEEDSLASLSGSFT